MIIGIGEKEIMVIGIEEEIMMIMVGGIEGEIEIEMEITKFKRLSMIKSLKKKLRNRKKRKRKTKGSKKKRKGL